MGTRSDGADHSKDDPPRIEVGCLTKRFGGKAAIDSLSMVVEPGSFVVLLGPSGSGKSTLIRCLAGIETPTSGTIAFDDRIVDGPGHHMPPEQRNLAMVFQDYALWPHLTAQQNVEFALQRRRIGAERRRRQAATLLDQVGLSGLHERYPGQLSGGEQQRVALARALVADPGLLLFDEPLSNLDADRRERLRIDIGAMARRHGSTSVYITHDQAEAFALADVVGVMDRGRLVQLDTPEAVYQRPASAFVARFTGLAGELPGRVEVAEGDVLGVATCGGVIHGIAVDGRRSVGQAVRVLVRPSAAQLVEQTSSDSVAAGSSSVIGGIVCDAAFRGWGYEHVVEVAGGYRLAGLSSYRRLPMGHPVQVILDRSGCLVVEDDLPAGHGGYNPYAMSTSTGRSDSGADPGVGAEADAGTDMDAVKGRADGRERRRVSGTRVPA